MIINFSVENFGSIKEKQTLSFLANKSDHLENYYIIEPIKGLRLNKLALIYGANASGKTTVLKALDFLREICTNPFDKKTDKFNFEPFLFDENTPRENTKFELEFVQSGVKYFYEVELNKNCIIFEKLFNYNTNKALIFERHTNEKKELTSIKFGSKIKKRKTLEDNLEIFTLWNNTVLGGFQKANLDSFELMESSEWFKNLLNLAIDNKKSEEFVTLLLEEQNISKSFILNILQKADLNISDLDLNIQNEDLDDDTVSFFSKKYGNKAVEELRDKAKIREVTLTHNVKGKNYSLNVDSESKGTQRYLGYSGLLNMLIKFERFIMPIDELEASLHPDLFQHFLFLFIVNSKNSQLIVTTHNREILNNRDLFRDDVIWFTDKNEDSATELYSLADFDSSVVRDTSNVFNAYKSGKLGGVPNLGDYYIDLNESE
ncbi:AAA family ATPase [Chryseobacterium sp. G0201]|uniref:AAA family ATPase n=1 Tax=Chryseobacterium sp. G0201 TaxID=2487065 RepID=UPI000F4DD0B0|nr:ATP-binding protein [Chryseobacterium sp. G0201]AZA52098.1 ATP-binding protein [Chryseobacterium sp. G0201]